MPALAAVWALASLLLPSGASGGSPPPLPEVGIPCTDTIDDVYVTPPGLPPWDPSVLGDVVRCAVGPVIPLGEVANRLAAAGVVGVTPFSGAKTYFIAYRTTRWDGEEGVGTARVYLPDTLHPAAPLPALVSTHGTVGLADHCAPSHSETLSDYLVLPFVGQGYAVVAPDYAGLGNEGTQGYGEGGDTGHSTLDAGRALRRMVTAGSLARGVIVTGHSQGGGAALSAQALGTSYGDSDVLGVVAFAPGWPHDTDALTWMLNFPGLLLYNSINAPRATLQLYADATNFLGPGHETDYFDAAVRTSVETAMQDDCILGLLFSLPPLGLTFANVLDDTFRITARECLAGRPGCAPPGAGYVQRALDNILSADPGGGEVLVLQGLQDPRATPENTACIVAKLVADGVTPQVCTVADADHRGIVLQGAAFAVDWTFALAAGSPLPPCAASELPLCDGILFSDDFESGDFSAWTSTVP